MNLFTVIFLIVACLAAFTNAAAINCVTPTNVKPALLSAVTSDLRVDFALAFDKVYGDAIRSNSIPTEQCVGKTIFKQVISANLNGLQDNEIITVIKDLDVVLDELYA